ncbi:MAG: GGDEF domain-containing protein [Vicinamibacterales bacterium]
MHAKPVWYSSQIALRSQSASSGRPAAATQPVLAFPLHVDLSTRLRQFRRTVATQVERVDVLTDVVRAAHAHLESRRIAGDLVTRVSTWCPLASWSVWTRSIRGTKPTLVASSRPLDRLEPALTKLAGTVIESGEDVMVGSLRTRWRGPHRAALGLTMNARGQTMGALVGVDARPSAAPPTLDADARVQLALVVDLVAGALDAVQRLERAERLAATDDLTQLYNSRFLQGVLRREVKRAVRSERPLSLLFLDFDNFKQVNDEWGHIVGSRALVTFSQIARRSTRETDIIARFGGDEFAVVLPDTDAAGAAIVGERVRARVETARFPSGGGRRDARLSISVGVASLVKGAATAEALLRDADEAMYDAKRAGGNAVRVARTSLALVTRKPVKGLGAAKGRMRRVV